MDSRSTVHVVVTCPYSPVAWEWSPMGERGDKALHCMRCRVCCATSRHFRFLWRSHCLNPFLGSGLTSLTAPPGRCTLTTALPLPLSFPPGSAPPSTSFVPDLADVLPPRPPPSPPSPDRSHAAVSITPGPGSPPPPAPLPHLRSHWLLPTKWVREPPWRRRGRRGT